MSDGVRRAIRSLGRESARYGFGLALAQLGSFLLMPILTHALTRSDYGVVSVALTTASVISTVAGAGLSSALLRSYYDMGDDVGRNTVVSTSFIVVAAWSCLLVALSALVGRAGSAALFGSPTLAYLVVVVVFEATGRAVVSVLQSVLRAEHRAGQFVAVSLVMLVARVVVSWLLVAPLALGLKGYAVGTVIGMLTGLVHSVLLVRRRLETRFSLVEARLLVSFGLPVMVANLAYAVLVGADRYFLRAWHGLEAVAVYNVGYQLASIVTVLLVTPINMAWPTILLPMKDSPDLPEFVSRSLTMVCGLCGWAVVSLAFGGPLLVEIVAPQGYGDAAIVIPIVALANSMVLVQRVLAAGPELTRRMRRYAFPYLVAAIAVVVLDWLVIPGWGMYGAAAATLIAYALLPVIAYRVGTTLLAIHVERSRLVAIGGLTAGMTALGIFAGAAVRGSVLGGTLAMAAGVISYPALLFVLRVIDRRSVLMLWRSLGVAPSSD